jgi:hypothetical protein
MNKQCCLGVLLLGVAASAAAQTKGIAHPYLLWTKEEAAAIRKRVEADPLARQQYERMVAREAKGYPSLFNLFKFGVMGDAKAGEAERAALLRFVGKLPPGSQPGNPASSNATWRDDRTLDALRYDILHDLLSAEERKGVEDTIAAYVNWFKENPGSHGSRGSSPRTGWLPNMQWPTLAGIHVLAAASGDERLIKQVFETPRGWKWFFDVYIADGRFYMEEFAKYPSNIGAMILWCEGLERLGLSRYGWGYKGKGGANMRDYLQMLMWAGYPRIENPNGMPDYPCVTMGDAGVFHVLQGHNADGSGGTAWYHSPMMWGATKMMQPLWWEAGHRRFPDAGFDYFLAQMRKPGDELYLPSLYFGLGPVDPKKVKAPPAPSYVTAERGFALLRMEEGPAYWESPRPAVGLQFGMYYVHYVHDCFSILQYVAHNRYMYQRMGAVQGGYAGGDPWRDHVRGQAGGVVVDGLKAQFVDGGEEGIKNERMRSRLDGEAKFVAIRAKGIYPDVDMERALVLTDAYLLDLFRLTSDRPRVYDWHVMSPAALKADAGWLPLEGSSVRDRAAKPHLTDIRVMDVAAKPWIATLAQDHLPGGAGVKVWMLGEEGTVAVSGKPPIGPKEVGVKLLATRKTPRTLFAALHEPFKDNKTRIERFERLQQTEQGLAAKVAGRNLDDRALVRFGDDFDKPLTLGGEGESFTFSDSAFIRIGKETVTVSGDLKAMKLRVVGKPALTVNGEARNVTVKDGMLEYAP